MRIGLVIYGGLETLSGGYLYDRKLVEGLRRDGHTVEIVSLPWRSYLGCLADNLSQALLERLRRLEVDILLQDELNHPSLFWVNRRLRQTGARYPILTIVHHLRCSEARPHWQNRFYRLVERRYLETVQGFIFNSQTTRQAVRHLIADLHGKPQVVACPAGDRFVSDVSEAEIRQRAREPGPLRAVFIGNLIARKGLHTLLEALPLLPQGACQLTVVGSPEADRSYAARIRRQIAAGGLGGRVQLCGSLDEKALTALLRSQHVLAVPSSYEGYGIVYLEGMSFGLPAIATTAGAAREIITHGQDGFLIPPAQAAALAEALGALADDRARLVEMGLAARRRFLAQPTWEQTAGQIRDFLLAVATETG
jgi:glycosyltransferase involved in cell wall biosynthesis